jgi:hypothetical protein
LIDFSQYDNVFCDSVQALEWAYKQGLPESAIIKSSEPAMLWSEKGNIHNVEARWTNEEIGKFQSTIRELTENVFDAALDIVGVERELALAISQFAYQSQKLLYKAACLDDDDFTDLRLFIHVDGKVGPAGNMMNAPWEQLLQHNALFSTLNYTLRNDEWKLLSVKGISYWQRFKVAGCEAVVYRLAIKIMEKLPNWMFKKELLMPNENELNIEIASSLALHGVKITNIQIEALPDTRKITLDTNIELICQTILPIMRKRVEVWVVPSAIESVMLLHKKNLEEKIKLFNSLSEKWKDVISDKNSGIKNRAVLMNSPGNIKGQSLAYVCRKKNIPFISSQHGVTVEISKAHDTIHVVFENSLADVMFSYNSKAIEAGKRIYFNKSKYYSVGMPLRLIRMGTIKSNTKCTPSIVFISAHFYGKGFSTVQKTDYILARDQHRLITEVLGKLPHKVYYKTYPMDNRRNADNDPILSDIDCASNMEILLDKVDMRYLISKYSMFLTTCATSTVGWLAMSGKPVIFINQKNNHPLTHDAYVSFSKGLFVFSEDDKDFHIDLRNFLSKSFDEIEKLWKKKYFFREKMIKDYFSEYKNGGAGKRAAKIIYNKYL